MKKANHSLCKKSFNPGIQRGLHNISVDELEARYQLAVKKLSVLSELGRYVRNHSENASEAALVVLAAIHASEAKDANFWMSQRSIKDWYTVFLTYF